MSQERKLGDLPQIRRLGFEFACFSKAHSLAFRNQVIPVLSVIDPMCLSQGTSMALITVVAECLTLFNVFPREDSTLFKACIAWSHLCDAVE